MHQEAARAVSSVAGRTMTEKERIERIEHGVRVAKGDEIVKY